MSTFCNFKLSVCLWLLRASGAVPARVIGKTKSIKQSGVFFLEVIKKMSQNFSSKAKKKKTVSLNMVKFCDNLDKEKKRIHKKLVYFKIV